MTLLDAITVVQRKTSRIDVLIAAPRGENSRDHVERMKAENEAMRLLVRTTIDLLQALQGLKPIIDSAESNASGTPAWDDVGPRIAAARRAVERVG